MGFWNKVGKVVGTVIQNAPAVMEKMQQEGAKQQATMRKEAERRINDHERKVVQASNSSKMNNPEFSQKVKEEKEKIEKARAKLYTGNSSSTAVKVDANNQMVFGGLTVSQWNSRWIRLGMLGSLTLEDLSPYNSNIGLYKAEMKGQVAYVGKAIEYSNGGFRKRLRDYVRDSDSARTHGSGKKMNEHADQLHLSILVVGNSLEEVETVKALEIAMISKLNPSWNVQHKRGS